MSSIAEEWQQVVWRLTRSWTGYQLGLQNLSSGDAKDRDEWFVSVLADYMFTQQDLFAEDVEDWMNKIFYDDFDLVLEDESSELFARTLIDAKEWFGSDRPRLVAFLAGLPNEESIRQSMKNSRKGAEDESDDNNEEMEEDEDQAEEDPKLKSKTRQRTVVDEEGWTTVHRR